MLRLLSELSRGARLALALAVIASLLSGGAGAALIALLQRAIAAERTELALPRLQFTGLAFATLALQWAADRYYTHLRHSVLAKLREHLCGRVASLPFAAIESRADSRLLTLLTQDVTQASAFITALPALATQGAIACGCLVYLAWLSWPVFLLSVATIAVAFEFQLRARRTAETQLELARAEEDQLFSSFQALLAGAKELRLNAARRGAFLASELTPGIRAVEHAQTRGLTLYARADLWGNFLFFLALFSVIFGAGIGASSDARVESGYALVLLYLMHPLDQLMRAFATVGSARVSFARMRAVGAGLPEVAVASAPVARPGGFEVRLRGVTHTYRRDAEDGAFRLGPIDLELRAGEVLFLIGGNGSGKTTLAKLLAGLYEPEAGEVYWNGSPLPAIAREAYRQNFSAVFSDFHLFDPAFGLSAANLSQRADELLETLRLRSKVSIRDGMFSSTSLSAGQRKRLALLVGLLEDRPAYIFDEWAADQDPDYKRVFYDELLPSLRARGKAVLVIAHDDDYFDRADRCLRLSSGQLDRSEPMSRSPEVHRESHAPRAREARDRAQ